MKNFEKNRKVAQGKRCMLSRVLIALLGIQLIFALNVYGQQTVTVRGMVTDTQGQPLPGATVVEEGTANGTATNNDGTYTINVPGNASLVFSFVGMSTQNVAVNFRSQIDIQMEGESVGLDEVVAIGYGTESRRRVTGSVSEVESGLLENRPTASVTNLLQGASSGVQVIAGSGQPGSAATIRIRGSGSLSAGNEPLYIIDGVPFMSNNSAGSSNVSRVNALADINPNDIEKITILKDAASASIYGSRASNGVVLITTKKGKSGEANIDLNIYSGIQRITQTLPVIGARESRQVFLEKWVYGWGGINEDGSPNNRYRPEAIDTLNPGMGLGAYVDHQNIVFQAAPVNNFEVSISGGKSDLTYSLSANYYDQEGIIINSGYRRVSTRINADYQLRNWIKIGTNFSFSNTKSKTTREGSSNQTTWYYFFNSPAYTNSYDPVTGLIPQRFPENVLKEQLLRAYTNRVFGNIYTEIKIFKDLNFRSNFGSDISDVQHTEFYPSTVEGPSGSSYPRYASDGATFRLNWVNENYFTYLKNINDIHSFNVMAGMSMEEHSYRANQLVGFNGPSDKISTANASSEMLSLSSNASSSALLSYYSRFNYNYKYKYLLSASFRVDGSSKFGKDKMYATFPSVSLGWIASEENFLSGVDFISNLKLRTAWGQTGNQSALGDFQALGIVSTGYNYESSGIGPSNTGIPNASLTWEESTQIDLGLDFSVINNRFGIIIDWYSKNTKNLLTNKPLPSSTGFSSLALNLGQIKNTGVDFEFNANILTGKLKWLLSGNLSFLNNEVIKLADGEPIISGKIKTEEGKSLGNFFGYEFAGVYATDEDVPTGKGPNGKLTYASNKEFFEGTPVIVDQNNDGIINADDRIIMGNALADYTGGITSSFEYKGIELSAIFTFSVGNDIWNADGSAQNCYDGLYQDPSPEAFRNRWQKTGDITEWPRIMRETTMYGNYYANSNKFLEDGSYLKFRNITLAYNFDENILKKIHLNKLRLYIMGENIRTWTEYTGYDPELVSVSNPLNFGTQSRSMPMSLSFTFGANIGF